MCVCERETPETELNKQTHALFLKRLDMTRVFTIVKVCIPLLVSFIDT